MEDITLILTVASIIVPVCATIIMSVYTVEMRVKAEHKPYVVLSSISQLSKIDKCYYFITLLGKKLQNKCSREEIKQLVNQNNNIYVKIALKNIGYGVATNIRFYNLDTAEKINGNQEVNESIGQKLFTTFDIGSNEEKGVQTFLVTMSDNGKILEDSMNILCIYQDLNGNVYNFVFTINIKTGGGYSYYAYQRSSHSYKKLLKKYRMNKMKILLDYYK